MGKPALNDNARYAYRYLIENHNLQPHQAAGIVGNLMQESTMNTGARNPGDGRDGSDSIGIGQWNGERAVNLRNYAGENVSNLDRQLDFVLHEMKNGGEGYAWKQLQAAQDIPGATAAMISYERPQGWSRNNPMGGHGWDNRLAWAAEVGGANPADFVNIQAASNPVAAQAQAASGQAAGSAGASTSASAGDATADKTIGGMLGIDVPKGFPDMLKFASLAAGAGQQQPQDDTPRGGLLPSQPVQVQQLSMGQAQTYKPWEQMLTMFSQRRA
ncbi:phage tail tip lysozyme [Rhizobium mongolense]|uniref:Phage tail lysozyme domain-containing protein n=2 Tax=Rhizobium mongolense TaxID=57676 RepID=A0ABR6IQJ1_9HYPH|nr:phage tail tip lysozyme [Rhizobium mongolense]MBB4230023.1 hypothetical protein [Rhizobium mongolense]TVZ72845.1 hypothetical protein BCL32_1032 [Rhizobium mongolense USDA 1844]